MPRQFNVEDKVPTSFSDFAALANDVNFIRIPLDTAVEKQELKIGGSFFKVVDASSLSAQANIEFDWYNAGSGLPIKRGGGFRGLKFNRLLITNTAQAGEWLDVLYCLENSFRDFEIFDENQDFTEVSLTTPTTLSDVADVSLIVNDTDTIAANAARTQIVIYHTNVSATAELLRVGEVATDSRGVLLQPGGYVSYNVTGAIQIHNPSTNANTQTYGYYELS